MKSFSLRTLLTFLLLLGLGLLIRPGQQKTVDAAPLGQTNLLNNPGLEEPYSNGAAQGWARWHQELNSNPKPANCSERYMVLPSWSPEFNGAFILEGARSEHVGNQFDTWRAGVMQNVAVTAGRTYRFTFSSLGRASNEQVPAPTDSSVNLGVRAGIDPNGSGVWSDADIVWGGTGSPHGGWQQFSVEATAVGNQITVFMQGDTGGANQCRAHLDIWFDGASLVEAGPAPTATSPPQPTSPPAPPAPVVTNTPVPPTETATPEVTPTDTPEPSPTPTDTPVPPMGGTICVNAFSDGDANGQRSEEEGYMAGVTFTIARDNEIVTQGVSTGTDNPLCFEELDTGSYQVAQILPRNLETTTAPSTSVDVEEGSSVSLEFGSRFETAEEVANANTNDNDSTGADGDGASPTTGENGNENDNEADGDAAQDGSGVNLLAVGGLVVILVAILVLGALIFILIRQARSA
jgi:hypothetical protein